MKSNQAVPGLQNAVDVARSIGDKRLVLGAIERVVFAHVKAWFNVCGKTRMMLAIAVAT